MRVVPTKNLVIASEKGPSMWRPSNQARLVRAKAANGSLTERGDFLPMGDLQCGNGMGDNGLTSRAAKGRFSRALANARLAQVKATGSPNASPTTARTAISVMNPSHSVMIPSAPTRGIRGAFMRAAGISGLAGDGLGVTRVKYVPNNTPSFSPAVWGPQSRRLSAASPIQDALSGFRDTLSGLGAIATGPLGIAMLAVGAIWLLHRNRARA